MEEKDRKRVKAKLDEMSGYVQELKEMLPEEKEYREDTIQRRACDKTIELAIESLMDVISILVSSEKLGLPKSETDLIEILVDQKIISSQLGQKIKDMKGFRNIIVHKYGEKDNRLAYKYMTNELEDFEKFKKEIENYLQESAE